MNWLAWIIPAGAVAAFLVMKRLTLLAPETAREWLGKGAKVIDVRSEVEFQEQHLPGAINMPLNRLGGEIVRSVPNKEQAILLHCLSGGRSGIGVGVLKRMGYQRVFNLGSYGRAARILRTGRQ